MGIKASRREACAAVRGNPSRMKEADGSGEGAAEEVGESQFLECSLARIRRKIVSSGTRLPFFMADSASIPARAGNGCQKKEGAGGIYSWAGEPHDLRTKRRFIPHTLPQKIPRTDGRELGEALHEAFRLSALADTRGPYKNDARRTFEFFGRHGNYLLEGMLEQTTKREADTAKIFIQLEPKMMLNPNRERTRREGW